LNLAVLSDDILNIELQEAVKGLDLLGDETMLLEVGLDDSPSIVSFNRLVRVFKNSLLHLD
jgi:hypothetical protein